MNKVKTIVTINKYVESKEKILEFIKNGVSTFRIDLGSTTHNKCISIMKTIEEINEKLSTKVSVIIDTKGPRISIGKFVEGKAQFHKNDKIRIYKNNIAGDKTKFSVDYKAFIDEVPIGTIISFSTGVVSLEVVDRDDESLICLVLSNGVIESGSFLYTPGYKPKLDFLNKSNKEDIEFAASLKADYITLSYVSCLEDVLNVNDMLIESGNNHTAVISKIENESALEDLDEILKISEGLLIARNDLGSEIPAERIPGIQKKAIHKCHLMGKISIVSMDIFDELIEYPTRAEVSDLANSVLDGTDAILLGLDPVYKENTFEVLKSINKVIETAEKDFSYMDFYDKSVRSESGDIEGNLVSSAALISHKLKCNSIIVPTLSGTIAKKISRFRPDCPIIAFTTDIETAKSLNLYFGIYTVLVSKLDSLNKLTNMVKKIIKNQKDSTKEKIIILGNYSFENLDNVNFIEIEEI